MEIVETAVFTKRIKKLLSDKEYEELQCHLVLYPESGKIISGSNGLRKLRWKYKSDGKRSGIRVIYYYFVNEKIYMLFVYKKSEINNLTKEQIKLLKMYVEKDFL